MSDEHLPSAIAAASDGTSASPSEILLQPMAAQSHADQEQSGSAPPPPLERSVTAKDNAAPFEFDWGLVLPSAAHEELGGEIATQLADRLVEDLSDLFGPDHISVRILETI